jgi:hypothetical protein
MSMSMSISTISNFSNMSNFASSPFVSNFTSNVSRNFYSLMSYPSINFSFTPFTPFFIPFPKNISLDQRKETKKPVKVNRKKFIEINRRVNQPFKGTRQRYCPMVRL